MRTRTILRTAAVTGVALLTAAPLTASATFPGANGRILFHRIDDNGFTQLWTANPDLTAAHQLTSGDHYSGFATWAPDGSRIAFDSDRNDPDPTDSIFVNDVFTMRADGRDIQKLTDSVGFSGDPAYSPDGRLIAFDANRGIVSGTPDFPASLPDLSIFVMNTDGSGLRRVTIPPAGMTDQEPRFSPDGQTLLFTRFRGPVNLTKGEVVGKDVSAIFVVNTDGSGERRVTGWGLKTSQADWSPDGKKIVYEMACCRLGAGGIFTVNANGSGFTALVNGHGVTGIGNSTALQIDGYYDPVWSPDGTKVISGREYWDGSVFRTGLVMVNADGSGLHWLSDESLQDHQPDWSSVPLE